MVLSKDLKIAICFGLIMGAILSLCNLCFAADTEQVIFSTVANLQIDMNNSVIATASSGRLGFAELEPGYMYTLTNNKPGGSNFGFSNESPSNGVALYDVFRLESGESFNFYYRDFSYVYLDSAYYSDSAVTLTRVKLDGLSGFVDSIAVSLSYINLNNIVANVVPVLAIGILLALGFYLLKRLLNKIKRAKGGA